jgi:hypothetical protein
MITPPANVNDVPVPPDTMISIQLSAAEWNQVTAILQEGPFRIVAPLIGKIIAQARVALGQNPAGNGPLIKPPQGESHGVED